MRSTYFFNELKLFERTKLKLATKISAVKQPDMLLLDRLDVDLQEANVNSINIPSVQMPEIVHDFCPSKPELDKHETALSYIEDIPCQNPECPKTLRVRVVERILGNQLKVMCPVCEHVFISNPTRYGQVQDFTKLLEQQLLCPEIESFPLLGGEPRKAGKSYQQTEADEKQLPLFGFDEGDTECDHGLKKRWCSTCVKEKRQRRDKTSSTVSIFDLILPILQPSLGDNFDSSIAFPPGKKLYPFQRKGVKFLTERDRALLGDEMGLGKSIQAIIAIRFRFRLGKLTGGLLLCPRSVLADWEKKLWDWAPELRVEKVRGSKPERQVYWNTPAHVYLTTYETLRQDLFDDSSENSTAEILAKKKFDFVILDEVQKIKNPSAYVTKAARQIDAKIRWGLSGTPLENRVEELVSIFQYIKQGLLRGEYADRPQRIKEEIRP